MWVVISDVFLDQPEVLEKLGRVFSAFEGADVPPALFVLIGEFCSTPFGPASPNLTETRGSHAYQPSFKERHAEAFFFRRCF